MTAVNRRMTTLKAVTDQTAKASANTDDMAAAIVTAAPCTYCRSAKRKLTEAARTIEQLQFQIERMSRAVQRDSSFYERRSINNGKKPS